MFETMYILILDTFQECVVVEWHVTITMERLASLFTSNLFAPRHHNLNLSYLPTLFSPSCQQNWFLPFFILSVNSPSFGIRNLPWFHTEASFH